MGSRIIVENERFDALQALVMKLAGDDLRNAAALGLNEHTDEQRRMSVVRVSAFTGVPSGYVGGKTTTRRAVPAATMEAAVVTKDKPFNIAKFGSPVWSRSMAGAEVAGWNVRRIYEGTFVRNGVVLKRVGRERKPLTGIYGPVLANELLRRDWKSAVPNPVAAEAFMAADLTSRVLRIMQVKLGF